MLKNLEVLGWTVLFYPMADMKRQPKVGVVVEVLNDCVNLQVYRNDGSGTSFHGSVSHISDERLYGVTGMLATRARTGAWDVLPKDRAAFERMVKKAETERAEGKPVASK